MKTITLHSLDSFLRTRARQQASWDGKQSTVFEPHYPVYRGSRDLL
jgi:hypothetical protein